MEHDCTLMGITTRAKEHEDARETDYLQGLDLLKGQNKDEINWRFWLC